MTSVDPPQLSPEEEQERWLQESIRNVKANAFHMKRALDQTNLKDALVHSGVMLNELRTGMLSPQKYYELYMKVFDELQHLEGYFMEEVKRGTAPEDMYEIVQHAVNIVPRMYLLITVGSVYMKSKQAAAKDILRDLVEMCKGVQHPTRGLFLRNYLSQIAKNKLPDRENEYEGEGGSVQDSVDFILQNFNEMVRLWVRMETKGIVREKEKRERERKELRILVGYNLVRLSQLEGVDIGMYQESVLSRILDVIIQSKDQIAQQYLMDCIIQVFPDEYHLATLQVYLESCMLLHSAVDVRSIFTSLMDRLSNFAAGINDGTKVPPSGDLSALQRSIEEIVPTFSSFIARSVTERPKTMNSVAFVETQLSLLKLVLKAFPKDLDKVDSVLEGTCSFLLQNKKANKPLEKAATRLLNSTLVAPMDHYSSALVCLKLQNYSSVMQIMEFKPRREVAQKIAECTISYGQPISTPGELEMLLTLLSPLLIDEDGQPDFDEIFADEEDFAEEQHTVGRLLHLIRSDELDVTFKMYSIVRKQLGKGDKRMRYTLHPMVFCYLRLAMQMAQGDDTNPETVKKIFNHALGMLQVLRGLPGQTEAVLRMYLQTAVTCDQCGMEDLAYEAMTQAMDMYERDDIGGDSKLQIAVLKSLISTIQSLKNLSGDNYDTISTKVCHYSSKLLKKPDQCQAACACSHLFWTDLCKDETKVIDCLQRSLKIVDGCMASQQVPLFVMILNEYLYFYQLEIEKVQTRYLNALFDLINQDIQKMEESEESVATKICYENTLRHIRHMREVEADPEGRWASIIISS